MSTGVMTSFIHIWINLWIICHHPMNSKKMATFSQGEMAAGKYSLEHLEYGFVSDCFRKNVDVKMCVRVCSKNLQIFLKKICFFIKMLKILEFKGIICSQKFSNFDFLRKYVFHMGVSKNSGTPKSSICS